MDPELVTRAQRGDQAAFARLLGELDGRFHSVAFGILRDMHLAQDAVQQAMLQIWRDLPQLREPAAFDGWAYRVLVRICQAESKRAKRWLPALPAPGPDPIAARELGRVVDRDELERGFRQLTVEQRSIIVLHHYLDLSHERAAEILGVSVGTARSRLSRALQALRAALEAEARASIAPDNAPEAVR
jgi:RNA polymerase sigma-70 factor (ECF subfamily)